MTTRVLVIGGYGNFGSFISKTLARDIEIKLIIGGRSREKAIALAKTLTSANPTESVHLDINRNIAEQLEEIAPDIAIHTSGPFQSQGYNVAEACISLGCHYIDLSDGREFVKGITCLDSLAKKNSVIAISGASSVPCLTAALIDHYKNQFHRIESLDYGITTAQRTARGLATTAAILGYTGKPFKTLINGNFRDIYGWQGLRRRKYRELGWRLLGNCDVPDLALFPERYPQLKTIRFYAGLEIPIVHLMLWLLSWLVRLKLIRSLKKAAPLLLKTSHLFDWFGSKNSALHFSMTGPDNTGCKKNITFELVARSGDGPHIPCVPAILLARKITRRELVDYGAQACVGLITRDEYLDALADLDISWTES